jgi:hypothetical protein
MDEGGVFVAPDRTYVFKEWSQVAKWLKRNLYAQ